MDKTSPLSDLVLFVRRRCSFTSLHVKFVGLKIPRGTDAVLRRNANSFDAFCERYFSATPERESIMAEGCSLVLVPREPDES